MGQHGALPNPGADLKPNPGSALADLLGIEPTSRRPQLRKCLPDEGGHSRSGLAGEEDGHGHVPRGSGSLLRQVSLKPFMDGQDPNRRTIPFVPRDPLLPRQDPLLKHKRVTP